MNGGFKDWKLHHDNESENTSWPNAGVPTVLQLLYSLDVAPPDFFLFPRLKIPMKGQHFGTIKDVCTKNVDDFTKKHFRDAFDAWKARWR